MDNVVNPAQVVPNEFDRVAAIVQTHLMRVNKLRETAVLVAGTTVALAVAGVGMELLGVLR